mmetsp:Transcript_14578/g.42739  ORF Transcript_14578/g.42739 Transcript_14578/m.42739 type:complete len:792 (-) Transcript_14578:369-2744(-)
MATAYGADSIFHKERDHHSRIIAHFDFDAFYVACEREKNPEALLNVPVGVSQYNPYGSLQERSSEEVWERLLVSPDKAVNVQNNDTNGSLIAVSYEARAAGVRRNDRGHQAAKKCPDLRIVQVPVKHGKADLTMYRDASQRVLDVLISVMKSYVSKDSAEKMKVEKASIDEIYIDLTAAATELANKVQCQSKRGANDLVGKAKKNQHHTEGNEDSKENCHRSWHDILASTGVSLCTTIAGVETMSEAAMAAACLSKDELRRGSKLQVMDSASSSLGAKPLDNGSLMWWGRDIRQEWTEMELRLACGAALASYARNTVLEKFHAEVGGKEGDVFTLSAGISTNKTLAKLASGLKKPNRQTLINPLDGEAIKKLFHPLKLGRIRGLGGKFGDTVAQKLGVNSVGDLARIPLSEIERAFPSSPDDESPTAKFLFFISRGICTDEVENRTKPKSIACSKTFRGPLAINPTDATAVKKWVGELCSELVERISADRTRNSRIPSLLIVAANMSNKSGHSSRSVKAPASFQAYTDAAVRQILKVASYSTGGKIVGMSVSASSFVDIADGSNSIMAAFGRGAQITSTQEAKSTKRQLIKPTTMLDSFVQKDRGQGWGSVGTRSSHMGTSQSISPGTFTKENGIDEIDLASQNGECIQDSKNVDTSVLEKLPPGLRVEVAPSTMYGNKRQREPGGKQVLDNFLVQRSLLISKRKASGNNDRTKGQHGKAKNDFFGTSPQKEPTSRYKSSGVYHSLTWGSLDQNVLDELPSEVKATLLEEMSSTKAKHKGKKARIDNYFSK